MHRDERGPTSRLDRKLDHIRLAVETGSGLPRAGFSDVRLVHRALPGLDFHRIRLETNVWGRVIPSPFFIDAMTGGPPEAEEINAALGRAARSAGWSMAVGSQTAALDRDDLVSTYAAAGAPERTGLLFANLPASIDAEAAMQAVTAIDADILQLHLNPLQEMLMPEGDRCFSGVTAAIGEILRAASVPVVVKEVGTGISLEDARELVALGVDGINVAGLGGTSFAAIELRRHDAPGDATVDPRGYGDWGLPTVISLLECAWVLEEIEPRPVLVASGGVRTPLDAVKCLVLGADLVSLAAPALEILLSRGEEALVGFLRGFNLDVTRLLLCMGAAHPAGTRCLPYLTLGATREWLSGRGLPTARPRAEGSRP